ncbi:MAG: hypothetical protein PSN34_09030 [Urechidicola sp.]|nr:hypothetical protein [Urechidicola sp.]
MKKLVIALIVLMTFSTQAQKKMNLTAEQAATLQTKEMTLRLELNEQQQKKVYALAKERAEKREIMREEKQDRKDMSQEQRYEAKLARLDSQIEMQGKMKNILNEKQFDHWKENMQKRENAMKKRIKKQKGKEKGNRS